MLNSSRPTAPPPRYCSKRRRTNPRWISSRTPPAIITTTAKMAALRRVVARSASGLCGTLRICSASTCTSASARITTRNATGISTIPSSNSWPVGPRANSVSRKDWLCAARKNARRPASWTVSSSVSPKMNGALTRPSAVWGCSPAAASTVMMTICVGKPEQSRTSSPAAARSIGSTAGGCCTTGGSIASGARSITYGSYSNPPTVNANCGPRAANRELLTANCRLLTFHRHAHRQRCRQLHRESGALADVHLFAARREHIARTRRAANDRALARRALAAGDAADHRARRGRRHDLQRVFLLGRGRHARDGPGADPRRALTWCVELREAQRDESAPLHLPGPLHRRHVSAHRGTDGQHD